MFKTAKQRLDACGIQANKNYRTLGMYINHMVNSLKTDNTVKQYLLNKVDTLLHLDKQGFECKAITLRTYRSEGVLDTVLELTMLKHNQIKYESIVANNINPDTVKALIA